MEDHIRTDYGWAESVKIQEISFDYLGAPGFMGAKVGLGEVENAQAVALLEQLLGQSSAQIPGSACDQDIGHNIFLP
jgi:hypothetical protein